MKISRRLKAQTGILIVVAVVIFAVLVVLILSQVPPPIQPGEEGVEGQKALLKADLESRIYAAAFDVVKKVATQGGYLDLPEQHASFGSSGVPYWGICQNKYIPGTDYIQREIKRGIKRFVMGLDIKEFQGKSVSLGQLVSTDVSVRSDDVAVKLILPASLGNQNLDQNYDITIPLSLGKVHEFSRKFVEDNAEKRHFERYLVSLFYHADPDMLPTTDLQTECGEVIFKTWEDVRDSVDKLIDYGLSHLFLWKNPPENRTYLNYYIPDIGGKSYPDLDIRFYHVGELAKTNLQPSQVPLSFANVRPLYKFIPHCLNGYAVTYTMTTPFVVSVKSGDLSFNFALFMHIKNDEIGLCTKIEELVEPENYCETSASCGGRIEVTDAGGTPIQNAKIAFGSCLLGLTGTQGIAEGKVPCGIAELVVHHPNYNYEYDLASSSDLNKKIVLKKSPLLFANFNKVMIAPGNPTTARISQADNEIFYITLKPKDQTWGKLEYLVSNIKEPISVSKEAYDLGSILVEENTVTRTLEPKDINETSGTITQLPNASVAQGIIDYIPAGKYTAELVLIRNVTYRLRYCSHYHWTGRCDRHKTVTAPMLVEEKTLYDFELKESDKDIYFNLFTTGFGVTGTMQPTYNHSRFVETFKNCAKPIAPVSTENLEDCDV